MGVSAACANWYTPLRNTWRFATSSPSATNDGRTARRSWRKHSEPVWPCPRLVNCMYLSDTTPAPQELRKQRQPN